MDTFTYLIIAFIAASILLAAYHTLLLVIRTTNPVYGLVLTCAGAGGLFFIKQSILLGEDREAAILISTLALFTGIAAIKSAFLNRSIAEENRTLASIIRRFLSHYKSL